MDTEREGDPDNGFGREIVRRVRRKKEGGRQRGRLLKY